MTFTYDIESMIGAPKVATLKVGDCIMELYQK